jgi:hypothetical protein
MRSIICAAFIAAISPILAEANCIQTTGKYRVSSHPTAIVEYRQIGCESIFVRKSDDGIVFTPEEEWVMDGEYRGTSISGYQRAWFEGTQFRRRYFVFDPSAGRMTEYVDHWSEFDAAGDLVVREKIDDLVNGYPTRDWQERLVLIR